MWIHEKNHANGILQGRPYSSARIRTGDLGLMNPALYQLSYAAVCLHREFIHVPPFGKRDNVPSTRKAHGAAVGPLFHVRIAILGELPPSA